MNTLGEIIGVDIITPGNYVKSPFVEFKDSCGNGTGAIGVPILGPVPDPPGPGIGTTGGGGIDNIPDPPSWSWNWKHWNS